MSRSQGFVVRHAQPDEMLQVGTLVARVFSRGAPHRYNPLRYRHGEYLAQKPEFKTTMCRVGVLDEQIVSHAGVETYTLHYGGARLKVAGVSGVCTHPDFRSRGYASAVMQDTLAYMAEQGVHMALLVASVGDFYRQYGFSVVWPYYQFEVDSAEASQLTPRLRLRDLYPDDLPRIAGLYHKHWDGRVAFARTPENWAWRLGDRYRTTQVVEDEDGRVTGYISGHDLTGDPVEVVADSLDATITLLAICGRLYQEAGESQITWMLPPDDSITNYARQAVAVTVSAHYPVNGGWMARLIDTSALVDALIHEIIAQGQTVIPDLNTRTLVFNCRSDTVEIGLRSFPQTFSRLDHRDFIQVMFGSLRPAELAVRPHSDLHPDAVRLLEALFPPRIAALAPWDWF